LRHGRFFLKVKQRIQIVCFHSECLFRFRFLTRNQNQRLISSENAENIQILRYEHGQKYEPHFDYFHDKVNQARGGHRYATVLMYLSTVNKGGETIFPNAKVIDRFHVLGVSTPKCSVNCCGKLTLPVQTDAGVGVSAQG
jgi:hypothetical protein